MRRMLTVLTAILCLASGVQADSWPPPKVQAKASAGGEYVIRVLPGTSMGDVYGYSGMAKGPYASAEWYRFKGTSYERVQAVQMSNPMAPVEFEVTRLGALIAIDNWHNLGVGSVVTFYAPDGRRVRTLSLSDLYSSPDLARIQRTSSSIHWRCETTESISLETDKVLWVDDSLGGRFVFQVETGEFEYQRGGGGCKR